MLFVMNILFAETVRRGLVYGTDKEDFYVICR